jgi:hypothetical protein
MPLAGWMIDGWGAQTVLFFGFLGVALALGLLAVGQRQLASAVNLVTLALAGAMVTVAATFLMPTALMPPSRSFPAFAFGLGYTVVAMGYFAVTWLWPRLEQRFGYRQALLGLGLSCLAPAMLLMFIPSEDFPSPHPHSFWADWSAAPSWWLVGFAVFIYFSLEQVLDVWTRPFLSELGYKERVVTLLMVGFWLAFLLARISAGWVMRPGFESWFLLTFILISAMIMGNLAGAYAPSSGIVGFWLVGACYGPLLPTFLAVVYTEFKDKAPATALGGMLSLAAINSLAFRPWFVAYARTHSARAAMRIPMLLGLAMAAATLVLSLVRFL